MKTWLGRHGALLCVLLVLGFVAVVRLRLADVPIERDEGEYAYAGQLILQGIPPYKLAYNMKFPGTYYAYGVILALFGQTPWGIHVGLLFVNAATAVVLFYLARRVLTDALAAAVTASAFAFLSVDRGVLGAFAHATHFVLLPALAGLLVLLGAIHTRTLSRFMVAGALLSIAVLMKQQAIVFLAFGFGLVLWSQIQQREPRSQGVWGMLLRSGTLAAGTAIPFVVLFTVLAAQGVFGTFWFWTIQYAKEYVSEVSLSDAWASFKSASASVTRANLPTWILSGIGVVALWLARWTAGVRPFLTGFLVASFLAVCPGFYFRQHYFVLLLPVAALFVGLSVAFMGRLFGRFLPATRARTIAAAIFIAIAGVYVSHETDYLFSIPTRQLSRTTYGANPFVEAPDIARYIREKTTPDERIAVLGSEPEVYFYANRKSATGYIYTYALMEAQPYAARMQKEMMDEIEAARPSYVVFAAISTSWLARKSDEPILTWSERYLRDCYDMAGVADIDSQNGTTLRWDAGVSEYQPKSNYVVYTFRRKTDAPCTAVR